MGGGAGAPVLKPANGGAAAEEHERELQSKYWRDHSEAATLETMMLDSQARDLDAAERPEILSLLPQPLAGLRVLELGAGIGRFTGELAPLVGSIHAVDFMANLIEENERQNAHHGNARFTCADVTALELPAQSVDAVFSNWLFMYLSDAELEALAGRLLGALAPGGWLFFRESCFHQSGDRARAFNPSHYRSMTAYSAIMEAAAAPGAPGARFQLVRAGCVRAYVEAKGNHGQVYWLWRRADSDAPAAAPPLRAFLDAGQYSDAALAAYERVFGRGFVSTGGAATLERLAPRLALPRGAAVVDLGAGCGGGSFWLAETLGAHVRGIELSHNGVSAALQRAAASWRAARAAPERAGGGGSAAFEVCDLTTCDLGEAAYDGALSRDVLLHMSREVKAQLLARVARALRPGGRLLLTDYCLPPAAAGGAPAPLSAPFLKYLAARGYHLLPLDEYAQLLRDAGFARVDAEDATAAFAADLQREAAALEADRSAFEAELGPEAWAATAAAWAGKLERAERGEQRWGVFVCSVAPAAGGDAAPL